MANTALWPPPARLSRVLQPKSWALYGALPLKCHVDCKHAGEGWQSLLAPAGSHEMLGNGEENSNPARGSLITSVSKMVQFWEMVHLPKNWASLLFFWINAILLDFPSVRDMCAKTGRKLLCMCLIVIASTYLELTVYLVFFICIHSSHSCDNSWMFSKMSIFQTLIYLVICLFGFIYFVLFILVFIWFSSFFFLLRPFPKWQQ